MEDIDGPSCNWRLKFSKKREGIIVLTFKSKGIIRRKYGNSVSTNRHAAVSFKE